MTQVTALVLRAVDGGYRYGFEVMQACGLPSGTVYPALRRLEKAGLLVSRWEDGEDARAEGRPRRRTYQLSRSGSMALVEAAQKLADMRRMLSDLPPAPAGEA